MQKNKNKKAIDGYCVHVPCLKYSGTPLRQVPVLPSQKCVSVCA